MLGTDSHPTQDEHSVESEDERDDGSIPDAVNTPFIAARQDRKKYPNNRLSKFKKHSRQKIDTGS